MKSSEFEEHAFQAFGSHVFALVFLATALCRAGIKKIVVLPTSANS